MDEKRNDVRWYVMQNDASEFRKSDVLGRVLKIGRRRLWARKFKCKATQTRAATKQRQEFVHRWPVDSLVLSKSEVMQV
jgi:hypothetical protein